MPSNTNDNTRTAPIQHITLKALKWQKRWILYKTRPKTDGSGGYEKAPVAIVNREPKNRWAGGPKYTYKKAMRLARTYEGSEMPEGFTVANGVGVLLGGGLIGIDFDHAIKEGRITQVKDITQEEIRNLVAEMGSYTEVSISGHGIHILALSKEPYEGRNKHPYRFDKTVGAEMYTEKRFYVFTGDEIYGDGIIRRSPSPYDLETLLFGSRETYKAGLRGAAKKSIKPRYIGKAEDFPGYVEEHGFIWEGRFADLWGADEEFLQETYPGNDSGIDPSSVDYALFMGLIHWIGSDADKLEEVARLSPWYRYRVDATETGAHKWDERKDYVQRTIQNAIRDFSVKPDMELTGFTEFLRTYKPELKDAEDSEGAMSVREVLALPDRIVLALASVGSGKTHEGAYRALMLLEEDENNVALIVCPSKEIMLEAEKAILKVSKLRGVPIGSLAEIGGIMLQKGSKTTLDMNRTRLIITHYEYVSRRGFSTVGYTLSVQLRVMVEEKGKMLHTMIDEIDKLIIASHMVLTLDGREIPMGNSNAIKDEIPTVPVNRCPEKAIVYKDGTSNCISCMRVRNSIYFGINTKFDHVDYVPYPRRNYYNAEFDLVEAPEEYWLGNVVFNKVNKVKVRCKNENLRYQAQDVVDSLKQLNVSREFPLDDKGAWYQPKQNESVDAEGASCDPWAEECVGATYDRRGHKMPRHACGVRYLRGWDDFTFSMLNKLSTSIRMFTGADMKDYDIDLLCDLLDDRVLVRHAEGKARKVNETLVLVADPRLILSEGDSAKIVRAGRTKGLHIEGYKEKFKNKLDLKKKVINGVTVGYYHEGDSIELGNSSGGVQLKLTYLHSTLARGMNLPDYKIIVIHTRNYTPAQYLPIFDIADDEIAGIAEDNHVNTVVQAEGRNMRLEEEGEENARRVIILADVGKPELIERYLEGIVNRTEQLHLYPGRVSKVATIKTLVEEFLVHETPYEEIEKMTDKKSMSRGKRRRKLLDRAREAAASGVKYGAFMRNNRGTIEKYATPDEIKALFPAVDRRQLLLDRAREAAASGMKYGTFMDNNRRVVGKYATPDEIRALFPAVDQRQRLLDRAREAAASGVKYSTFMRRNRVAIKNHSTLDEIWAFFL